MGRGGFGGKLCNNFSSLFKVTFDVCIGIISLERDDVVVFTVVEIELAVENELSDGLGIAFGARI